MDRVSHREYLLWQRWFSDQWNRPDRHDWYLMRVCQTLVKMLKGKKGQVPDLEFFKVKFEKPAPKTPVDETDPDYIAQQKSLWHNLFSRGANRGKRS